MLGKSPVSRQALSKRLGVSDRALRVLVNELRKQGVAVCSCSNGRGYWIGNAEDRRITIAEYRHRAYEMLKIANALEGNLEGQIEMGEICGAKTVYAK